MRTTTDLIQSYKELYDEGALTLDEYAFLKKSLLDQGDKTFSEKEVRSSLKLKKPKNKTPKYMIKAKSSKSKVKSSNQNEPLLDQKIQEFKNWDKYEPLKNGFQKVGCFVLLLVFIVLVFFSLKTCIADLSKPSPEYTTYYVDDNGNGKLDKGEWNYTEDEDGNMVDRDDDLSNFE